jgi:hypothetical protein
MRVALLKNDAAVFQPGMALQKSPRFFYRSEKPGNP